MTDLKTQIEALRPDTPKANNLSVMYAYASGFEDAKLAAAALVSAQAEDDATADAISAALIKSHADTCDNSWISITAKVVSAQSAAVAGEQKPVACGACNGSGWVPRDPDIGTEQECFSCGGSGESDDAEVEPREPVGEAYFQPGSLSRTMATFDYSQVPPGAKLYTHPAPADVEALRGAAEAVITQWYKPVWNDPKNAISVSMDKLRAALAALGKGV